MTLRLNRRHFLGTAGAAAAASSIPMRAMAATPMTMQAAWINDAEFAGYFLAMDQGYYTDEGLDLTYLSGGPDVIPESTIIAGRADLALTTPDTTIKAIVDQGSFEMRVVKAQINPRSDKRASVEMEVITSNGNIYPVTYSMYKNAEGRWYMENVIVFGVNIGLALRDKFELEYRKNRGDIDAVIASWSVDLELEGAVEQAKEKGVQG